MPKVSFTTPIGVARYPKISKPDTTGDYADNKYKTDLVLSPSDMKEVKKTINEFAKQEYGDLKGIKLPFGEAKDKETGEVTEFVRFKSARKPIIIDAKRNKVPDDVDIFGGSKIRVGGTLNAYKKAGNKGVNIYLNAVQVIELVTGFNMDAFEEVADGFEVDTDDGDDAKSEFDL
jgi:hypothetical protein